MLENDLNGNGQKSADLSYPAPAIYKDNLPIAMGMPFTPRSPSPRILDPSHDMVDQEFTTRDLDLHLPSVTTLIRASSILGQLLITKNSSKTVELYRRRHTFTDLAFVLDGNELKTKFTIRSVPVMICWTRTSPSGRL